MLYKLNTKTRLFLSRLVDCMYTASLTFPIPGPAVIKLFSCSTQLSMKFFLLINVKMPTIVGILTYVNRKNSILGLSEPEKCLIS